MIDPTQRYSDPINVFYRFVVWLTRTSLALAGTVAARPDPSRAIHAHAAILLELMPGYGLYLPPPSSLADLCGQCAAIYPLPVGRPS